LRRRAALAAVGAAARRRITVTASATVHTPLAEAARAGTRRVAAERTQAVVVARPAAGAALQPRFSRRNPGNRYTTEEPRGRTADKST
jgi:hypothetical protein